MEKTEKNQRKEPGRPGYLNKNCWLIESLNYAPYKRCQYCGLKFRHCLFLHYQIVSLILILFFFTLSFLIDGRIPELVIISVFTLVIVYGYFFNKSTDKIIQAYFTQGKAKEALEELTENLEQRVKEQTKNIEVLSEMKSEFLKIVNHQLRTPTTIIMSLLSMVQEGSIKGEERVKEILNKAYLSSQRLITILDDILNAQELVGERPGLNLSPYKIEDIISKVLEHFRFPASQKNLTLNFKKLKKSLPQLLLDEERIERAISKLIDNAILYTPSLASQKTGQPEKGKITVSVNLIKINEKDFLQIKVKDTGIGITKEDMQKLFKIFSRGKEGLSVHANGSGLGLYIAKEYVEAHRGKIEAESEGKDKGSTFIITLPIIAEI